MFSTTLDGAEELYAILSKLPEEMERSIIKESGIEAMQPVLVAAKAHCPVYSGPARDDIQPGKLRDSIKVHASSRKGQIIVLVQTGAGDFKGDEFYGPMVELGHGIGKRPGGKNHSRGGDDTRPRVPAHPFLRPSLDESTGKVVQILGDRIRNRISALTP